MHTRPGGPTIIFDIICIFRIAFDKMHMNFQNLKVSDCKNARLRGNDKLHIQCILALCLYRDTTIFLVYFNFNELYLYRNCLHFMIALE